MSDKKVTSKRKRSRPLEPKKAIKNPMFIIVLIVIFLVIISAVYYIFIMNDEEQDNPIAVIDTTMGSIKVELFENEAPKTCENFIKLVNNDFYEGLVFHRIANLIPSEPNTHVIQGGGFYSDGINKPSPYGSIDLEINKELRHVDGAIAMARTTDPNSATSQFYICDGTHSFLDDDYAVFGIVIDGIDVVSNIANVQTTTKNGMQNWPVNNIIINSISIEN